MKYLSTISLVICIIMSMGHVQARPLPPPKEINNNIKCFRNDRYMQCEKQETVITELK